MLVSATVRRRRSSGGRTLAGALAVFFVSSLAGAAVAFVLPGPYVLQRAARALRGLRSQEILLEVEQGAETYVEVLHIDADGALVHGVERDRPGVSTLHRILRGELGPLCAELGVDLRRTSLALHEERVVVVVGVSRPDPSGAQLWIDQRSFVPTRLMVGGRELRLSGLHTLQGRGRFYTRLEVVEGGRRVWLAKVLRVRARP